MPVAGGRQHSEVRSGWWPRIAQCLQVLSKSQASAQDCARFVMAQLAFWLLGAIDGHAKNFSIFIQPGGGYISTPLYDVLSAWPVIGHGHGKIAWQKAKMAMAVPGTQSRHYHLQKSSVGTGRLWQSGRGLRACGPRCWRCWRSWTPRLSKSMLTCILVCHRVSRSKSTTEHVPKHTVFWLYLIDEVQGFCLDSSLRDSRKLDCWISANWIAGFQQTGLPIFRKLDCWFPATWNTG